MTVLLSEKRYHVQLYLIRHKVLPQNEKNFMVIDELWY